MGQNDGDYFAGWVALGWQGELWRADLKTGEKANSSSVISLGIKGGKLVYSIRKPTLLIINPAVEKPFLGISY